MSERENLIALIRNTYVSIPPLTYRAVVDDTAAAVIADHLLANGVVVREKGEWVRRKVAFYLGCPSCGCYVRERKSEVFEGEGEINFCPNCGADMRKGENG